MLHTIFPQTYDVTFRQTSPQANDYLLQVVNGQLQLFENEKDFVLPRVTDSAVSVDTLLEEGQVLHTGSLNGQSIFLYLSQTETPIQAGTVPVGINALRENADRGAAFAALNAFQLAQWVRSNRFCGRCGTTHTFAPDERALYCPTCKTRLYPRINPAIITAIIDPDTGKMLCARGIHYKGGFYSLIAGYVEVGESFEQAVKREVMEEVGLKVKNITYFANQPWPFSSSQMVGFFCLVDGDRTPHPNPAEIGDAQWYAAEEIPEHPFPVSIASVMMDAFRKGEIGVKDIVQSPFAH